MVVTVNAPVNQPPTANAGTDQSVTSGTTVTLAGSGTDPEDGTTSVYEWTAPAGVTLSSTTVANPTFTAPTVSSAPLTLTFSLVVKDSEGKASAPDTVVITVNAPVNQAPTANAGADQSVTSGTTVTLSGSGTDPEDGATSVFEWTAPAGVTLSSTTVANPTFTAPTVSSASLTLTFSLVVKDSEGKASAPDTVVITVNAPVNQPPVATPQTVDIDLSTTSITLSGNDPDGDNANLTYEIVDQPTSGSLIISNNFVTYSPNSFPPIDDSFTFRVIDEKGASSIPATITLVANKPPVIIELTPPITVTAGDLVTINGLGTDPEDGSNVTYSWSSDSNPPITGNSSSLTFSAVNNTNQAITVIFTLQVFDTKGLSSEPGMVNVTINPLSQNQNPVVFSKEVVQEGGNPLTIDLSLSDYSNDPDGDPLTFEILSVNAPVFTLDTTNLPLVVASDPADIPISGTFTFQATDPGGLVSNTGTITIRFVSIPNQAPVADAGSTQTGIASIKFTTGAGVSEATTFTLDGSKSRDAEEAPPPNNDEFAVLNYQWTQISGPATVSAIDPVQKPVINITTPFTSPTDPNRIHVHGVYVFQLIVTDNGTFPLSSTPATVSITVDPPP